MFAYTAQEQIKQCIQSLGQDLGSDLTQVEKQIADVCSDFGDQGYKFLLQSLVDIVDWSERPSSSDGEKINLINKLSAIPKLRPTLCGVLQSRMSLDRSFFDRFICVVHPTPETKLALCIGLMQIDPIMDEELTNIAFERIHRCLSGFDRVSFKNWAGETSGSSSSGVLMGSKESPQKRGNELSKETFQMALNFLDNRAPEDSLRPNQDSKPKAIWDQLRQLFPENSARPHPELHSILYKSMPEYPQHPPSIDPHPPPKEESEISQLSLKIAQGKLTNPAPCLRDCGPKAMASTDIFEAFLNLFAEVTENDAARMVGIVLQPPPTPLPSTNPTLIFEAVLRNISNHHDPPSASNPVAQEGFSCTKSSNSTSSQSQSLLSQANAANCKEWKPDILIPVLQRRNLDWHLVWTSLDYPEFIIPNRNAVYTLFEMINNSFSLSQNGQATATSTKITLLVIQKWKCKESQFSLLKNALGIPRIFNHSPNRQEPLDSSFNHNDENTVWLSLDLLETMLRLGESDLYQQVRHVFKTPLNACPGRLLNGLIAVKSNGALKQELMETLMPDFLVKNKDKDFSALVMKNIWKTNPTSHGTIIIWMRKVYHKKQKWLHRIMEIVQEIGESCLSKLVALEKSASRSTDDFMCIMDFATLAAKQQMLTLEPWVQRQLQEHGERFVLAAFKFLTESLTRIIADTIATFLKCIMPKIEQYESRTRQEAQRVIQCVCIKFPELSQYNSGKSQGGESKEQSKKNEISSFNKKQDYTKYVNSCFEKLYAGETSLHDFVKNIQKLKKSADAADMKMAEGMLFSLLDESRFHEKYPDKELNITANLYGLLIKDEIIEGYPLGLALRCVLAGLKKESDNCKLCSFGIIALQHFKHRAGKWPMYFEHVLQIPYLNNKHPDLIAEIKTVMAKNNNKLDPKGKSGKDDFGKDIAAKPKMHFGHQLNLDSLLSNNKKNAIGIDKDSEEKIHFLINNVSTKNLEKKAQALSNILKAGHHRYFAQYLVTKRVSVESNHHESYLSLLNIVEEKVLNEAIIDFTYRNIHVLLQSKEIITSSSERTLLRNLGSWLGKMTIAKSRVLKQKRINIKRLILEAYDQERLIVVIPFMCKILESCKESVIFQWPNPWLTGILALLAELYNTPQLKLTLQFEIEKLFSGLGLEVKKIPPSKIINRRKLENMAAQIQDKMKKMGISEVPSPNNLLNKLENFVTLDDKTVKQIWGPSVPGFSLKRIVCHALDKAIKEIIQPIVERSVHIACITTKELVTKDFTLEASAVKMKQSAHQMVKSLTGALALVTSKEPLLNAIVTVLTPILRQVAVGPILRSSTSVEDAKEMEREKAMTDAVKQIAQDNIDLGCSIIQKAAADQSVWDINEILRSEFQSRQSRRDRSHYQEQLYRSGRFPGNLPEPLRPKLGGLTELQSKVYAGYGVLKQNRFYKFISHIEFPDATSATTTNATSVLTNLMSMINEINSQALRIPNSDQLHIASLPTDHQLMTTLRRFPPLFQTHLSKLTHSEANQVLGLFPQKMVEKTWKMVENSLITDVNVAVLALIKSKSPGVVEIVTEFIQQHAVPVIFSSVHPLDCSGEAPNSPNHTNAQLLIMMLARERLLTVSQLDSWMAEVADPNRRTGLTNRCLDFCVNFVTAMVLREDKYTASEFKITLRALGTYSENEQKKASQAGKSLRPNCMANEIVTLLKELEAQEKKVTIQTGHFDSDIPDIPEAILEPLRDPRNYKPKMNMLFDRWICNMSNMTDQSMEDYLRRLQQMNCLKGEVHSERFFRNMIEIAIEKTLATARTDSVKKIVIYDYTSIDGFCKLFSFLIRYIDNVMVNENRPFNHYEFLKLFLRVLRNCLLRSWAHHPEKFQQRIYYRFIITILISMVERRKAWDKKKDHVADKRNLHMLALFAQLYHDIRPERCPGFTFAWVELISHRHFMPPLILVDPRDKNVANHYKGRRLFHILLVDLLRFQYPHLDTASLTHTTLLLYRGTLRVLLVLLHDFPEFLCEFHTSFCDVIPTTCVQMRNLILSAFPRKMRLPDPFLPNLKVDLLPEIRDSPVNLSPDAPALAKNPKLQELLVTYIKIPVIDKLIDPSHHFYERVIELLIHRDYEPSKDGSYRCKYDIPLINYLVIHIGRFCIERIKIKQRQGSSQQGTMEIFVNLLYRLDHGGRYYFLNSIANHLRYPNNNTHFFSCVLLVLFESDCVVIKEAITRVLLERLIVHRPHPWGLLITFIELIKNPRYKFWEFEFTRCAPEIERLFESVARSCMAPQRQSSKVNSSGSSKTHKTLQQSLANSASGSRRP